MMPDDPFESLHLGAIQRDMQVWGEQDRRSRTVADAAEATLNQATKAVDDIVAEISWFEQQIEDGEEARIIVIGGPSGQAIFPTGLRPQGHDRIVYSGTGDDGCRVTVLQHVSQLNIMLKAVRVGKESARRIGFHSPDEDGGK